MPYLSDYYRFFSKCEEMIDGKSEQTVFEACCERDNESFSAFEAWLCDNAEQNA